MKHSRVRDDQSVALSDLTEDSHHKNNRSAKLNQQKRTLQSSAQINATMNRMTSAESSRQQLFPAGQSSASQGTDSSASPASSANHSTVHQPYFVPMGYGGMTVGVPMQAPGVPMQAPVVPMGYGLPYPQANAPGYQIPRPELSGPLFASQDSSTSMDSNTLLRSQDSRISANEDGAKTVLQALEKTVLQALEDLNKRIQDLESKMSATPAAVPRSPTAIAADRNAMKRSAQQHYQHALNTFHSWRQECRTHMPHEEMRRLTGYQAYTLPGQKPTPDFFLRTAPGALSSFMVDQQMLNDTVPLNRTRKGQHETHCLFYVDKRLFDQHKNFIEVAFPKIEDGDFEDEKTVDTGSKSGRRRAGSVRSRTSSAANPQMARDPVDVLRKMILSHFKVCMLGPLFNPCEPNKTGPPGTNFSRRFSLRTSL